MGRFNFDAFAGGIAKGIQTEQDMRLKRQAAEREDERFQREKTGWEDADGLKAALKSIPQPGAVRGAYSAAPVDFASQEEAQAALEAARRPPTPMAAAPQQQAIPRVDVRSALAQAPGGAYLNKDLKQRPAEALPAPSAAPMNFGDIDVATAVPFKDPYTGKYRITDEKNARKVDEMDVYAQTAAAYMRYGQPDKALAIRTQANQLMSQNIDIARKQALAVLDQATLTGQVSEQTINNVLNQFNRSNDITLGGEFKLLKTDKGYTIGAAPDGTGLPAIDAGFGTFKSPADVLEAVRATVSGEGFGQLRQRIFDQDIKFKEQKLREATLAESVRSNKIGEAQRGRGLEIQAGSAASENRLRAAQLKSLETEKILGIPDAVAKRIQTDVRTAMTANPDLTLSDAYNQALDNQPTSVQLAWSSANGMPIVDPRKKPVK